MTIRVLDPTQSPEVLPTTLAKRQSIEGPATLALLSNGKSNAARLLRFVKELLAEQMEIERVIEVDKESASTNASEVLLDELADACDLALVAIGD